MGHDVTTFELDRADGFAEFIDVGCASLHHLQVCLQLEHQVREMTLRVFDMGIGGKDGEVCWIHEHIGHACVLKTDNTSSIVNALCLGVAVTNHIVAPS